MFNLHNKCNTFIKVPRERKYTNLYMLSLKVLINIKKCQLYYDDAIAGIAWIYIMETYEFRFRSNL